MASVRGGGCAPPHNSASCRAARTLPGRFRLANGLFATAIEGSPVPHRSKHHRNAQTQAAVKALPLRIFAVSYTYDQARMNSPAVFAGKPIQPTD